MNEIIGELPKLVDGFIANILSYAVVLATVATITMTFLELIKATLKIRLRYHRGKIQNWMKDQNYIEELMILTVTGVDSADALLDQPTDKMLGQIQAATNVAIDFPDMYPHFYEFLTRVPVSGAAKPSAGETAPATDDASVWRAFITSKDFGAAQTDDQVQQATRARARIDHFVARKLDAFQTQVEYDWARKNQMYAVTASAALLTGLLIYLKVPGVPAVVLAFFGGMMAPLAKDVVSALSGLKTK